MSKNCKRCNKEYDRSYKGFYCCKKCYWESEGIWGSEYFGMPNDQYLLEIKRELSQIKVEANRELQRQKLEGRKYMLCEK